MNIKNTLLQLGPMRPKEYYPNLSKTIAALSTSIALLVGGCTEPNFDETGDGGSGGSGGGNTTEVNPRPILEDGPSNFFCEAPPEVDQDGLYIKETPENAAYIKILQYHSMNDILKILSVMRLDHNDGTVYSGYQVLLEFLEKKYDKNLGLEELKERIDTFFEDYSLNDNYIIISAIKQYLLWIAQSLWVEHNGIVPWSLKDYSQDQIYDLFYEHFFHGDDDCNPKFSTADKEYRGFSYNSSGSTIREDITYQLYPLAKNLYQPGFDQHEVIIEGLRFIKSGFFHAYANDLDGDGTYEEDWDFSNYTHEDPVHGPLETPENLSAYIKERISYCHEPAFVLKGIYRALNIPATTINYNEHSMVALPTEGKFIHGDNPVMLQMLPAEDLLTPPEVFINNQNLEDGYLRQHLLEKYGSYHPFLVFLPIRRTAGSYELYLNLSPFNTLNSIYQVNLKAMSPDEQSTITSTFINDFPQYKLQFDPQTYNFSAQSVNIRTLEDFSIPGKDPWQ